MTDAPSFGYCPHCGCNRPLELDWTCCGCGQDTRLPAMRTGPGRRELPQSVTGLPRRRRWTDHIKAAVGGALIGLVLGIPMDLADVPTRIHIPVQLVGSFLGMAVVLAAIDMGRRG